VIGESWRGSASSRGYDAKWRSARKGYLQSHPLCVHCLAGGIVVAARVVDHIAPHGGDHTKFWDTSNWQSLCVSCHSRLTAKFDGGFGNRRKLGKFGSRNEIE
jgi:5-methylcytosine-specific restriction protein A